MPLPYEPPSLPSAGDANQDDTFCGVGRVMSAWETLEFQLSRLHSYFLGDPDGDAIRDYGKGSIFSNRVKRLSEAAEAFFVFNPDQALEGEFDTIVSELMHLANRRNEVAHGIRCNLSVVAAFADSLVDSSTQQYGIIAPYYCLKNHNADGLPKYAYTSSSLKELEKFMAGGYLWLVSFGHRACGVPLE